MDDIVHDGITRSIRYAGFTTVKSNQAEIQVSPGRFYGPNVNGQVGAVYTLPTTTFISLVTYLAATSTKILTLVAYGVETQTDTQTRDFITNTTTRQVEPQPVPMEVARQAVLAIIQGNEGADPQPPTVPASQIPIANIVMDDNGVVSVTMLPAGLVSSTEDLDVRLDVVEAFDGQIGPRVAALAADLADLANQIKNNGSKDLLIQVTQDVARVKNILKLPSTYASYGASYFLFPDTTDFDTTDSLSLGFNALIQNGVRFPAQNADVFALALFNALDPNAKLDVGSGLLLPAYTEVVKLQTGNLPTVKGGLDNGSVIVNTTAMGQYGYQTFDYKELDIPYYRIRSGGTYFQCTNGAAGWWTSATSDAPYWLPNFNSYNITSGTSYDFYHGVQYTDYLWIDSWTQPYWTLESVNHTVNGALIAQSFLGASDMWLTKIGFYLSAVASATDVVLQLCQVTNSGSPDLSQIIARGVITGSTLVTGMNYLSISPTLITKGSRYAVVITSLANHSIGLVAAGSYMNGTFFYSLDGNYFLGDFSKELAIQLWGCKFNSNQTWIEFNALNLEGGIRAIDIVARTQVPASCNLVYEVLPAGGGTWLPIDTTDPLAPWAGAPVLARFRARFVGTPDIMPGIVLTDSMITIWCPGPAYKLVTKARTLPAPTTNVTVKFLVENYDVVAHTITVKLCETPPTLINATATTVTLQDASRKQYLVTATFPSITSTSSFIIVASGTTTSVANVYHIAQMVWYAL